jgi:hypothetical protein
VSSAFRSRYTHTHTHTRTRTCGTAICSASMCVINTTVVRGGGVRLTSVALRPSTSHLATSRCFHCLPFCRVVVRVSHFVLPYVGVRARAVRQTPRKVWVSIGDRAVTVLGRTTQDEIAEIPLLSILSTSCVVHVLLSFSSPARVLLFLVAACRSPSSNQEVASPPTNAFPLCILTYTHDIHCPLTCASSFTSLAQPPTRPPMQCGHHTRHLLLLLVTWTTPGALTE